MKSRNQYFDYSKRMSRFDNDFLKWGYPVNGEIGMHIPWDARLVRSSGAHYHCWVPKNFTEKQIEHTFEQFKLAAKRKGNPVSFSWDFIPETI